MPTFNAVTEDTPDRVPPIEPGVYEATIVKAEVAELENPWKDGTTEALELELRIESEGDAQGRAIFDRIGLKDVERKDSRAAISLKRVARSAGLDISAGLDTSELPSRMVKIEVTRRSYTDSNGEAQEAANIKTYIPPEA